MLSEWQSPAIISPVVPPRTSPPIINAVYSRLDANGRITVSNVRQFAGLLMTGRFSEADKERIESMIRAAFKDVVLGAGVGLWEGQGLDDYADEETMERYLAQDEKVDWTRIPIEQLNRCRSSMSFFDAPGMRFHLPAFLIADLNGKLHIDLVFDLVTDVHDSMARFALLSDSQRHTVREFLSAEFANDFEKPMIEKVLTEGWVVDE